MLSRTTRILTLGLVLALVASACGSDAASTGDDAPTTDIPTTESAPPDSTTMNTAADVTTSDTTEPATVGGTADILDPEAPELGRVVALAEEFLLADLLALGIEPVASSATVDAAGFQGVDQYDTSNIEVLPMTTLSLEYLATLEPDTIITLQFWVDQIGQDVLDGLGEVIVVPDGLYGPERLTAMGDLLERPEHAAAMVAEYDAAMSSAQAEVPDDCVLSLATVYSGPSVAAFVAGPWEIPSTILEVGCELSPDASDAAPDQNGRAFLSLEQLGLLDSERLVLMQSDAVEGETEALEEIEANPVWQSLPAVQSDNVVVIDRLGYPGTPGQIRLLEEISTVLAGS